MQGKILFFNHHKRSGCIITQNKQKFYFDVLDNIIYEKGQIIDFEIDEQTKEIFIKDKDITKDDDNSEEEINDIIIEIIKTKTGKKSIQKQIVSEEPLENYIDYYYEYIDNILNNTKIDLTESQYQFNLVKRFLFTSYHNLKNLDSKIYLKKEIKDLYQNLNLLNKINNTFSFNKKQNFENIFLKKQKDYVKYMNLYQKNKTLLKSYYQQEKKYKMLLENISNQIEYKKINTIYVDIIEKINQIKKDFQKIENVKEIYKLKYEKEFYELFEKEEKKYKNMIKESLDYGSYQLDMLIKQNSKYSNSILQYLKKANIKEDYCLLTYIKYYLKNLDEEKMNNNKIQLQQLVDHIEYSLKGET